MKALFLILLVVLLTGCATGKKKVFVKDCQEVGTLSSGVVLSECEEL